MFKILVSILHCKHRNVIHPWDGTRKRRTCYELFGYYECLKCSRKKGYLILHKLFKFKRKKVKNEKIKTPHNRGM